MPDLMYLCIYFCQVGVSAVSCESRVGRHRYFPPNAGTGQNYFRIWLSKNVEKSHSLSKTVGRWLPRLNTEPIKTVGNMPQGAWHPGSRLACQESFSPSFVSLVPFLVPPTPLAAGYLRNLETLIARPFGASTLLRAPFPQGCTLGFHSAPLRGGPHKTRSAHGLN